MNPASSPKSPTNSVPPVIVAPEVSFARIARVLADLGWQRQPDTSAAPPLVPGEPEFATWRHGSDDALLTYSFHPVVGLRALTFADSGAGAHAAEIEAAMPTLDATHLVRLLRSPDTRENLLGLLGAGEYRSVLLYSEVRQLAEHADPRVAATALKILAQLRDEVWEEAERLGSFSAYPGTPHARRQALRHWAAAGPHDSDSTKLALGRALLDPDWEVRAGAIIFAARAGAAGVALAIHNAPLPEGRAEGVHKLDGRILRATRKSALRLLDPRTRAEERFSDPNTFQVDRCVAGVEAARVDRCFWLVTALTTPQPPIERPARIPPEFEDRGGYFHVRSIGLDFVWIPRVAHWLGGPDPSSGEASLSREVSPGVFVAREASGELYTVDEIERRLLELRDASGLPLQAAMEDWREMAVWGADARLFPWGNGSENARPPWTGPWGAVLSEQPEWVVSRQSLAFEAVGGPARLVRISVPSASLRLALRP